ncbi:LarC family nickel insertion protein [Methanofollis ethanolicus]|uniref:LarC family nickel insertion protein n=1 Tax=Methanofollis ethanolicus TaxID=488124 RepID=UPI000834EEBF|nr:LarC family nickel insertion protein [Methanofollis ethanolicus]
MKVLFIDPRAGGMSGDRFIAALADLTGSVLPLFSLARAIAALPGCSGFDVDITETETGIKAKRIAIQVPEKRTIFDDGLAAAMNEVIAVIGLSDGAATTARAVLEDLILAERQVRFSGRSSPADTIFTILGPFLLLEDASLSGCPVYATPPALGSPAPATLEICVRHRIPVSESPFTGELTTPIGAALLAHMTDVVDRFPAMVPIRVGYGRGLPENNGQPTLLWVVEGEVDDLVEERIVILETNIDDVTGEVIGYTVERLFAAGAVDVFVTSALGKKNRPVQVISVITDYARYRDLTRILMEETGTLGVRIREEPRLVAERSRRPVDVRVGERTFAVRVKTSRIHGRVVAVKPEYEDMKEIALTLDIPLRRVVREVQQQIPFPDQTRKDSGERKVSL